MTTTSLLICRICGSMDILKIDIVIDGVTQQLYQCQDCGFEWPVNQPPQQASEPTEE